MNHPIWLEMHGQAEAVSQLESAVNAREETLNHAWLFTGPPGSGRSNLARAFAAALLCDQKGCGQCQSCKLVMAGGHPDVAILATERVVISIEEIRNLVNTSMMGSTMGRYKIMIIEDADRMAERSSNVLLKSLEEPPARTIWMLCAPSEADLLPTIRSRVRRIALKVPSVRAVADLLVQRDGISEKLALQVAAEAQSHVGMAKRLAESSDARSRRRETLLSALNIKGLSSAIFTSERWLEIARKDAESLTAERDAEERDRLMVTFGLDAGAPIPSQLRSEFKKLEEDQKRRATRSLRDGLDRILVDLMSLYRDALMLQLGANVPLVNEEQQSAIQQLANETTAEKSIKILDTISLTRTRIDANVKDVVALDALAVELRRGN